MLDETTLMGKIVSFVMIGILGWLAYTTYNLSIQQAVITTEVQGVKELIVQMQSNYITQAEANIRFTNIESELTRLRDRMRDYENGKTSEE